MRRAYAGSRLAAHPRAGGENGCFTSHDVVAGGSSPRGRGKLSAAIDRLFNVRLIPARAGKTRDIHRPDAEQRAHPRAGGENGSVEIQGIKKLGSSPRGRGKPRSQTPAMGAKRLIPARAGKTLIEGFESGDKRAHPRAGGENALAGILYGGARGSSPRGRGKRAGRG